MKKMLIKNKCLFLIIMVLALASVSMVSAEEPTNNTDVVDCVSDLNTTHDLNQSKNYIETNNSVDNITYNSNVSFSSNILMNKTMTLNNNPSTIASETELKNALNNGGNYTITQDFSIGDIEKSHKNNVYINGNGHKIQGKDSVWTDIDIDENTETTTFYNCIFDKIRIDMKSDVTLHNCTIQNTQTGLYRFGSAIYLNGCLLTMNNCKIINATNRDGFHGAVYLKHGWANINNTLFQSCYNDAAWTNTGTAIYSSYTTLQLTNSRFDNCMSNVDRNYADGIVYIDHDETHINNCTFTNCLAAYGAAIFVNGRTYINYCKFFKCMAVGNKHDYRFKGVIDRKDSDHYLEVNYCLIDDKYYNTSGYLYAADPYSNVYVNPEGSDNNTGVSWDSASEGGAIFNSGSNLLVRDCSFINNSASEDVKLATVSFSSNILINKTISNDPGTIANENELKNALNNGGNYTSDIDNITIPKHDIYQYD